MNSTGSFECAAKLAERDVINFLLNGRGITPDDKATGFIVQGPVDLDDIVKSLTLSYTALPQYVAQCNNTNISCYAISGQDGQHSNTALLLIQGIFIYGK